jgi:hypothetical protein
VFEGVVLLRRGGGHAATFTLRKISSGVGVERIFPVESPNVTKVEIKSRGHVRRARLYYLRELSGKKARLRAKVRDVAALNVLTAPEDEAGTAEAALADEAAPEEVVAAAADDATAEAEAPEATASAAAEEAEAAAPEDGETEKQEG